MPQPELEDAARRLRAAADAFQTDAERFLRARTRAEVPWMNEALVERLVAQLGARRPRRLR